MVGHNGELHGLDLIGLGLSVLVAVVALGWMGAAFVRGKLLKRRAAPAAAGRPSDPGS